MIRPSSSAALAFVSDVEELPPANSLQLWSAEDAQQLRCYITENDKVNLGRYASSGRFHRTMHAAGEFHIAGFYASGIFDRRTIMLVDHIWRCDVPYAISSLTMHSK